MRHERILITGCNGFIGSHIASACLKNGYSVVGIGKSPFTPPATKNFTYYALDLFDKKKLEAVIATEKPTVICHHASSTSFVNESFSMPQSLLADTISSLHLLDSACNANVRQFIFASSASVYSNRLKQACRETSSLKPNSPLGIAKLTIESYCKYYHAHTPLKCTILRYFNVYGPGQRKGKNAGIVPNIIQSALDHTPLTVFGDGTQTRDFTYVADIVRANIALIAQRKSGIFNVASGTPTRINDLIATIENLMKQSIQIQYRHGPTTTNHSYASIQKIAKRLGWNPTVSLTTGLKKTIAHYK